MICISKNTGVISANEGFYNFDITYTDKEWRDIETYSEMVKRVNVDEKTVKNLSTENLVELLCNYPLGGNLYAFDDIYEGFNSIRKNFSVVDELLSRDDLGGVVYNKYKSFQIEKERMIHSFDTGEPSEEAIKYYNDLIEYNRELIDRDFRVFYVPTILELVMLNSKLPQEKIWILIKEKEKDKLSSEYSKLMFYPTTSNVATTGSAYYYKTISTRSGFNTTTVKYYYNLDSGDNSNFLSLIAASNALIVTSASTTFNCHSYAWLKDLYSDYRHMWLNCNNAFTSDPTMVCEEYPTRNGEVVSWSTHSCIVTNKDLITTDGHGKHCNPQVISKWANGPLVSHRLMSCPYYFDPETNAKYYR